MGERDKIKERVAKLLNMTLDRGASESEAMMAAEKAAELMTHWDIEASELSIRSARAIQQSVAVQKYGSMKIAAPVARHIAQFCDCMYWHSIETDPRDTDLPAVWQREVSTIVFFGLPADAEIAGYLFDLISNAIVAEIDVYKANPNYQREVEAGVNGRTAISPSLTAWRRRFAPASTQCGKRNIRQCRKQLGTLSSSSKRSRSRRISRPLGSSSQEAGAPIVGQVQPVPMQAVVQQEAEFRSRLALEPDGRLGH